MLSKVEILCFAADPFDGSLQLAKDVRKIRRKVGGALHHRALKFDWHHAVRPDDMLDALMKQRPQIVHFSGHGDGEGLLLEGADGNPNRVHTDTLRTLFTMLGGGVQVVLLSACTSRPQAEAICDVVGCAIGTRGEIPEDAAITFNAEFYRSIASGYSVQAAYDQARLALEMNHYEFRDITELLVRPDVDASKLVLVSRRAALRAAGLAVAGLAAVLSMIPVDPPSDPAWKGLSLGDCTSLATAPGTTVSTAVAEDDRSGATGPAADLARAKALCRAGDYAAAFELFESAAAALPEAMGFVGIAYQSGEGVVRDSAEAIEWLRKAASADDERAMNALAIAYQNGFERGFGVERQRRWAHYWLEKAATRLGSVEAMLNQGLLYLEERDDSLALAWFQMAADSGSPDGLVEVGRMHEQGRAVRRDPAGAARLYQRAADAGLARGMFEVGKAYQNGTGVARNLEHARGWYYKGACAGSADAMYHLGLIYRDSLGVPADRDEAVRWFRRAADAGSTVAEASLAQLNAEREPRVPRLLAWFNPPHPDSVPGCTV
jgi:TPR repeat protein